MDPSELQRLEHLCEVVYSGGRFPLLEQLDAQRHLIRLQTSSQYLPSFEYVLEHSSNQYALLFGAKGVLLVITADWRNTNSAQRIHLQRFLLQRLTRHVDPSNFITKALIHSLCRLTKLGWVSDPELRNITTEVVQFVNAGVPHAILGLRLLTELVGEFEMGRNFVGGRIDLDGRIAAQAFREHSGLTKAFTIAYETVSKAFDAADSLSRENQWILKEALITLEACLAYDFVGTGYSESDDVVACLYIPMEWTKHIANSSALQTLFRIYQQQWNQANTDISDEGAASTALQCIALLAATRRSVFDDQSRYDFLVALLEGSTVLMQKKIGLGQSEACLHHLCRLLSRMKSHFQLVELAKPQQYHLWLESLCSFTESVLSAWRSISSRSVHYLIRLWGALVLPTPYLRMRDGLTPGKQGQPNYLVGLDNFVPRVVQAFVSSRSDMCSAIALEELGFDTTNQGSSPGLGDGTGGIEDDPLDDEGMLLEQLAPLSTLARFRYSVSAPGIGELYVNALAQRTHAITQLAQGSNNETMKQLTDAQARLAFLTYVFGAIIGGHVTRVSARVIENLEELNAELAALVFRMIVESQRAEEAIMALGQQPSSLIFHSSAGWQLELASLYFFRCFQTLYIESRAREDELADARMQQHRQMIEDASGFVTLTYAPRRGAVSEPSSDDNPELTSYLRQQVPSSAPSLDTLNRGLLSMMRAGPHMSRMTEDSQDNVVVDELSASENAAREQSMNDEANAKAAAMQQSIAARVGVPGGDRALLDVAMRRIFGLLQYAQSVSSDDSSSVVLVERALSVLYQLSVGVTIVHAGRSHTPRLMSSGRLLLESDVIQDLLGNPSAVRFPLLREIKHGRARSFLMATLSKLLFTQTRYPAPSDSPLTPQDLAEDRFVSFMQPMTEVADGILDMVARNIDIRNNNEVKLAFVGLTRDLRGVISSATAAREYELVFAWLYPRRIQLLCICAQLWNDDLDIMVPLLKLLSEIVHNRGSRIVFPALSAGGLVLFREASKVLVAFCSPQLQVLDSRRHADLEGETQRQKIKESISKSTGIDQNIRQALGLSEGAVGGSSNDPMSMQALQDAVAAMGEELRNDPGSSTSSNESVNMGPNCVGPGYTVDLDSNQQKCSRVCLTTMTRLLNGRYASLGTFDLFGDSSLNDARRVTLELAVSGSPKHIMSFPKMARALIILLNQMAEKFLVALVRVSSAHFARILACLGEAIVSGQTALSTPAAATIEALASFRCRSTALVFQEDVPQSEKDPLIRIRQILNPEHRTRGDATSFEEYREAARLFQVHEAAHPHLFSSLLSLVMDQLFNPSTPQDTPSQWSLAKPVMPLVLCAPQEFENQRLRFLKAQSPDREQRVRESYDALFSKLGPALNNPARYNMLLMANDNFTKQLCAFCRDIQRD